MEKYEKQRRLSVELRAANQNEETNELILEGYALKFEKPTTIIDYTEIIDRHALDNCDLSDVCFKYNHVDNSPILARTRNKSLQLKVDEVGLYFRASLLDTTTNKDFYKMVKAGLIDKCSFAFTVRGDEYDYETNVRRITDIDKMYDVSIVDVPAYDDTEVYARSAEKFRELKAKHQLDIAKRKLKLKAMLITRK